MSSASPPTDQLRREIDTALALSDSPDINLAFAVLTLLELADAPDRARLLKHVCEAWPLDSGSGELKPEPLISTVEQDTLQKRYSSIVDGMFESLLDDNPPVDDFYVQLYELIGNPVFKGEHARAFALFWVLIDRRTPYFQLEQGLRVSTEDFTALGKKLAAERRKVGFILASSARFDQRTEEADLLLKELDRLTDPVSRVRLMAYLIFTLKERERRRFDLLLEGMG